MAAADFGSRLKAAKSAMVEVNSACSVSNRLNEGRQRLEFSLIFVRQLARLGAAPADRCRDGWPPAGRPSPSPARGAAAANPCSRPRTR